MITKEQQAANNRLIKKLSFIIVGMFVFAVGILPPMYDAICDITGLNGKTANEAADATEAVVDEERSITVMFIADTHPDMPWEFKPVERSIKVHPGEIRKVDFRVKNTTGDWLVGQAIPSVSPAQATPHFKKTECFCFNEQELDGNSEKDMPLIFYVDPELPKSVTTITLSYQLFNITDRVIDEKNAVAAN
ncbi:MAG: cytochrome c oxidase assembly protein [Pseudomonadales bacterium]|nr:cytochrome c oxidase assembly protein [Pseudomonadales bacterium]